jgi:hypothetical protein
MAYFFPETHELDAYVWFLTRRAKNIMAAPQVWERVEALAAALIERHTLSVEEAEQVMWDVGCRCRFYRGQGNLGRLVDRLELDARAHSSGTSASKAAG